MLAIVPARIGSSQRGGGSFTVGGYMLSSDLAIEPPIALQSYAELVKRKGELVAQDLVLALRDGRAIIRANAALGLAAVGYAGRDLLPFLRDSEALVARSAAEIGRAHV